MPAPRVLAIPALALIAGAYFALGRDCGIEWIDTGMLVYPSWRVARGALPYRDFTQLFGPSLFLVNGAVLRLFGEDLGVLRTWVLLLKVAVAVLVYLNARRLAAWPFALAAYGLLVVVWGTPFWIFNTPYANHYALVLQLSALWLLSREPAERVGGRVGDPPLRHCSSAACCAAAGVCLGLAATFKQTGGLFGAVALALAFVLAPPAWLGPGVAARLPASLRRGLRLAVPIGAAALFALYLAPRNTAWNVLVLATPAAALIASCVRRELRRAPDPAPLSAIFWIAMGIAIPTLACAAFFAWRGALGALIYNTLRGLPERIAWFHALPVPPPRTFAAALAIGAALLAVRRHRVGAGGWRGPALAAIVLGTLALADTLRRPLAGGVWYGEVYGILAVLIFAVVWLSVAGVVRQPAPVPVLFTSAGAVGLLFLYPAGDVWHLFMGLPLFLPLCARQAERSLGLAPRDSDLAAVAEPRFPAAVAGLAVLAAVLCAPFVHALIGARLAALPAELPRATGVRDTTPRARAAATVAALARAQPPERRVFMIGYDSLVPFLSARESSAGADDFLLYMVALDTLSAPDRAELLTDTHLRDTLAAERPLLVEVAGPTARRFRAAFPETAAFVDANTSRVRTAGPYFVLEWTR